MTDRDNSPGILHVVGTPIGNLEDITFRAVRILGSVRLVLAEDTRRTGKLLRHYSIHASMRSYHDHNKERITPGIVKNLLSGLSMALVCDSGTPGISDPGYYLVRRARESGITVASVPGASSIVAALSISGLPTDRFVFEGFLPQRRGERERRVAALEGEERTLVFFESPRRARTTLSLLAGVFPGAEVVMVREMTKIHEEVVGGKIEELTKALESLVLKGEIVLLIKPRPSGRPGRGRESILSNWELAGLKVRFSTIMSDRGLSPAEALRMLADETGLPRNLLYPIFMKK